MIVENDYTVQTAAHLPNDLIVYAEFAKRRNVHIATLHRQRMRADDPMPSWRVFGKWYVSEAEFAEWSARRSGRTSAPPPASAALPATSRAADLAAARECVRLGC